MVPDLLAFAQDPNLYGLPLSEAQETLLRVIDGLPLKDETQFNLYRQCTGLAEYHPRRRSDVTVIAGVRSGKDSRVLVPVTLHEAVTVDHAKYLAPGERAWHVIVAQGFRGSVDVTFNYIAGAFDASPLLASLIVDRKQYEIHLSNRASITAFPCTKFAPLGYTIRVGALSEVAYFRSDTGINVDREIIASVRRGQATVPKPRTVKASSPYARTGEVWREFQTCYGVEDAPTLVWRAESKLMNPSISDEFLADEERRDPEIYRRNYLAEFTESITAMYPEDAITPNIVVGRRELPPTPGLHCEAFLDSAEGTGRERTAVSIGYYDTETKRIVVSCLQWWSPPFHPGSVIAQVADLVKRYGCHTITGDRLSRGFVQEAFADHAITYKLSPMDKSSLFLEMLPRLKAGQIDLLDVPELLRELRGLERRTRGAGQKDRVDHTPGGFDDIANAVAGLVALLAPPVARPLIIIAGDYGTLNHEQADRIEEERKRESEQTVRSAIRTRGAFFPTDF